MSQAEKMSVSLTPKMRADLAAAVESGEFASTSEALRDAMRVWTREREERAQTLEAIRERMIEALEGASTKRGKARAAAE